MREVIEQPSNVGRVALTTLSAALFAAALPPFDLGLFGWLAIVPLVFAVRGLSASRAARFGALFGFVSAHAVFAFMFRFSQFGVAQGLVLGAWLALFPALLAPLLARFALEPRGLVLVPAGAVVMEWARAHAGFLALPFGSFASTQHANIPLLQLARFGGEPLVSIVVVLGGVALAQLLVHGVKHRPALVALALVALVHGYGAIVMRVEEPGRDAVVAAVQPAVRPGPKSEEEHDANFARLAELTEKAGAHSPDLVVWPETAVGAIEGDLVTKLAVRDVVENVQAPIVFGSAEVEKLSGGQPTSKRPFNSAYVMNPDEPVGAPYRKVHLLPFGEYRPIDLPHWLAPSMFDTEAGERRIVLRAGSIDVEPLICWENLFADDLRATASSEPTVIAHLVNDAWFGPTSEPELHNIASIFRAAESGRPLVLASNTGPSIIVDARGRVVARAPSFEPAFIAATVRMPGGLTFYRRTGDLSWAMPLLFLVAAVTAAGRIRSAAQLRGSDARRPAASGEKDLDSVLGT